jgi:RND family efflux transporter MFP subunit
MSEQEFELYLKLLSRCLGLTPGQREQIADELRDHLEQRLAELEQAGVARDKAVVQALDEFGDAAVLAANFAAIARLKRRKLLMRLSLSSVGALTAVLLITYAFWPENRAVRGPERVVAQDTPAPAVLQKQAEVKSSTPGVASSGIPKSTRRVAPAVPPVVEVCHPMTKEVTDYAAFGGSVQPSRMVQIRTRATGYLRKVCCRPGQVVKPGDLLFEIDPATYQVDVDKAKAEVVRAEAKVKLALAKSAYLKQQNASGNTPGPLVEESEQECQIARADLQMARANLESAQLRLGWTRMTAPIGGYISRSAFDVGSLVKGEESTLATIVSLDPVYVSITVDQGAWFLLRQRIQHGEFRNSEPPVEIFAPIGGNRQGFLEFVEDAVFDSNSGGTMMRVRVPNQDAALVAGLFVTVRYQEGKPHAALLVPGKALAESEGQHFVWILGDHDVPQRRNVVVARRYESDLCAITHGLTTDAWIIRDADSYSRLSRGLPIDPKRVP